MLTVLSLKPLSGLHRLHVTQTLVDEGHIPGVVTLLPAHELLVPEVHFVGTAKLEIFHLFT